MRRATDARIAETVAEATIQVRAEYEDRLATMQQTLLAKGSDDIEAALALITELQGDVEAVRAVSADLLQIEDRIAGTLNDVSRSVSTLADNLDLLEETTAETVSGLVPAIEAQLPGSVPWFIG